MDHIKRNEGLSLILPLELYKVWNPLKLLTDPGYKQRFHKLAHSLFHFVRSWDNESITQFVTRMYARKKYVKSATKMYTEALLASLNSEEDAPPYCVRWSVDSHTRFGSQAKYTAASESSVKSMNNTLREPDLLVLVEWGIYECTINNLDDEYNQSTLAIMVDVPTPATLNAFGYFHVWVAPPGTQYVEFLYNGSNRPSKKALKHMGWTEVKICVAPERSVSAQ